MSSISRTNLLSKSLLELKELCHAHSGLKPYTFKQIYQEMYHRGTTDFQNMTSLSKLERDCLNEKFLIQYPSVVKEQISVDRTTKWLLGFSADETTIETVFIPDLLKNAQYSDYGTLCISSQVGCSLKCSFCHTGTQKFKRNLSSSEIVGQVMHAMKSLKDFPLSNNKAKRIDNVVFMGQGEPLYNFKNVQKALFSLQNDLQIAPHRITVSTSGVIPLIRKLAETKCELAISLHATTDTLRNELVPLNKMYPIKELLEACRLYLQDMKCISKNKKKRRVTFEYVMLDNVNDSIDDARRLVGLLSPIPSLINLIPWNPWPGSQYKTSTRIQEFYEYLKSKNMACTIRKSRGSDIMAACGQLKSSEQSKQTK